jgi:hypothetical protein
MIPTGLMPRNIQGAMVLIIRATHRADKYKPYLLFITKKRGMIAFMMNEMSLEFEYSA